MTLHSRILVYLIGIHLGFAAVAAVVLERPPAPRYLNTPCGESAPTHSQNETRRA